MGRSSASRRHEPRRSSTYAATAAADARSPCRDRDWARRGAGRVCRLRRPCAAERTAEAAAGVAEMLRRLLRTWRLLALSPLPPLPPSLEAAEAAEAAEEAAEAAEEAAEAAAEEETAARASISTTNSGRAKPETTISVEAVFGSPRSASSRACGCFAAACGRDATSLQGRPLCEDWPHPHVAWQVLPPAHIRIQPHDVLQACARGGEDGADVLKGNCRLRLGARRYGAVGRDAELPRRAEKNRGRRHRRGVSVVREWRVHGRRISLHRRMDDSLGEGTAALTRRPRI